MAKFTPISLAEMTAFLTDDNLVGGKFTKIDVSGCREAVFARRIKSDQFALSLRVYTSLVGGESRDCGEDAICVSLFYRQSPEAAPILLGGSKRVHRVAGWKDNLLKRIQQFDVPRPCPDCGLPLVERKGKSGKFLGCIGFIKGTCRHTENLVQ